MRHLANWITVFRMGLVPVLFCLTGNRKMFAAFYLLAGLGDVLDGAVARATHTQSSLGAKLDSIADLGMFGVSLYAALGWMGSEVMAFLPAAGLVLLLRLIAIGIAAVKYRIFLIVHTLLNKATGLLLFAGIFAYAAFGFDGLLWAACAVGFFSALEELVMHLRFSQPLRDRASVFHKGEQK